MRRKEPVPPKPHAHADKIAEHRARAEECIASPGGIGRDWAALALIHALLSLSYQYETEA